MGYILKLEAAALAGYQDEGISDMVRPYGGTTDLGNGQCRRGTTA